jgi:HSP20 family protein
MSRWDPLQEFEQLTGQMNELLESAFGIAPSAARSESAWAPLVDIEETDDAYVIDADVPGVKTDDVNVEIRDNQLVITGELKERERKGLLRRQTRRTGRFDYRVTLPSDVEPDNVDAALHDGVLNVRVPKTAKATPRRIDVSSR